MSTRVRHLPLVPLVLLALVGGCSSPPPPPAPDPAPTVELEARLISPTDIALEWKGVPDAAGHVVEFATEPEGPYTTLDHAPPARTRYTHPDLVPQTTFYYRVRPFHGLPSAPVEVALPEPRPNDLEQDDGVWAEPRTRPAGVAPDPKSIRTAATAPQAAPANLSATLAHSSGVRFTWTDRSFDEEGFFVEVKAGGAPEFSVAAVVDPDKNSFGLVTLPSERHAAFRVRAFYYGKPSNVVQRTTGAEAAAANAPRPSP